jgi:hypothetical protein
VTSPVPGSRPADATRLPLHLWRRLDWRFLLPTLTPAGVACAGAVDDDLAAALPLLGTTVHRITGPADWAALSEGVEVVVLVRPEPADLAAAAAAVAPGGWVYAEVGRDLRRPRGFRTLPGWRRSFGAHGLIDVTASWHAPDLAHCSRIISLDARTVLRDALLRYDAVRFGAALSVAGRLAVRVGAFPFAVAEGSVVGRRPPEPGRSRP